METISLAAIINFATIALLIPFVPFSQITRKHLGLALLILLFLAALLPGSIEYITTPATIRASFSYIFFFLVLVLVLSACLSLNEEHPKTLSAALILSASIALLGVVEYLLPETIRPVLSFFRSQESLMADDNIGRAASIFGQRNVFGCFCALLAVGSVQRVVHPRPDHISKKLLISVLICAMAGTIASTSKNGIVTLVVGMSAIGFTQCGQKGKLLLGSAAIGCILLFLAILASGPDYGDPNHTTQEVVEQYKAESPINELYFTLDKLSKGRLHLWKYWWNRKISNAQYIWTGIGLGQFRVIHWDKTINTHSSYAQFLFEGGLIGFLSFILLIGYCGHLAYSMGRLPTFLAFATCLLFDHFFDYSYHWTVSIPWLLLL